MLFFLWKNMLFPPKNHVLNFLQNVHGTNNFVQKTTLQLYKSKIVMAECKVLGLMPKFVTGPLWWVIEQNKHVIHVYELLL
jgi:hypothetical protein